MQQPRGGWPRMQLPGMDGCTLEAMQPSAHLRCSSPALYPSTPEELQAILVQQLLILNAYCSCPSSRWLGEDKAFERTLLSSIFCYPGRYHGTCSLKPSVIGQPHGSIHRFINELDTPCHQSSAAPQGDGELIRRRQDQICLSSLFCKSRRPSGAQC